MLTGLGQYKAKKPIDSGLAIWYIMSEMEIRTKTYAYQLRQYLHHKPHGSAVK
jgi:hypothetical protein